MQRKHYKIEEYALIGDCETAALVSRDGSVDWLCWPRFDSEACFAALLGDADHGCWTVAPQDEGFRSRRRYRDGTLILETIFETECGEVELVDFMPLRYPDGCSDLVRLVIGKRGCVKMRTELVLRFGYGERIPWVSKLDDGTLRAIDGPDMVILRTPVALHGEEFKTVAEFTVEAGQVIPFVLIHTESHLPIPEPVDPFRLLSETESGWRQWSGRSSRGGDYASAMARSLITLKALIYAPTGGIVAAPTTSLPEAIGGVRNWDYRYCWLRDATLTLRALMDANYYDEARAWRDWLVRATAGSPSQIRIMYGIAGERRLPEWEADWLPGYEGSRPVRIGNAAYTQLQIDVFGEVLDTLYAARRGGIEATEVEWGLQRELLKHLETIWTEPDSGLWEVRTPPQHFTYSKVMAWVAFDRATKSAEEFGFEGPVETWRRLRAEIHEEVCAKGYDRDLGSFVQAYGSTHLDASLLRLPGLGFLPASDPRIVRTVKAIESRLMVDGLLLRYDSETASDGLPAGEGAFLACSFWLVDAYVMMGRLDDACRLFARLLALQNDLGLLAEEYDCDRKRFVGNFPQAFSHVGLVHSAHRIAKAKRQLSSAASEERPPPATRTADRMAPP